MGLSERVDVLIAGAGPTGLTLAVDLRRRGLSVRIIEQSDGPQQGSRGFSVKPRTLEVFDDLGVAQEFLAVGRVAARTRVHLGGALLADFSVGRDEPTSRRRYPNVLGLPEWRTEKLLRGLLVGRGVEFGTRLVDFRDDGDEVIATLDSGEQVRAAYLVGCDGGRSTVRKRLGLAFAGKTDEDSRALLADVEVEGLGEPDTTHIWLGAGNSMFVLRPAGPGLPWQAVASLAPGESPKPSMELLREIAAERTGLPGLRLTDPSWLSVWRYSLRMVDRYRVGRVFLAGDAAHIHSPFGGFGMNTGIQDAYNLGWKLGLVLSGAAGEALLDTYEAERLPVGKAVLAESDRNFSAASSPPRLLRPLIRLLVKPYLTRLNRRGRHDHPDYRDGPLSHPQPTRGRLRSGDSAPDATGLLGPDASPVRLLDLFRGTHFTLLVFGTGSVDPLAAEEAFGPLLRAYSVTPEGEPGARRLVDVEGDVRRAYHAGPGSFALVRPDGYLGLLSHRGCHDVLTRYFAEVLGAAEKRSHEGV